MQLSATFPGTVEQATYLRDLIALMGRRLEGETISPLQIERFPVLDPVQNIGSSFPRFDPDGFWITHSEDREEIAVNPSHPWAVTDPSALGFALRGMLERFARHDDIVSVALPVPEGGTARDADVLVCNSQGWSILTQAEAEGALRNHQERVEEDARLAKEREDGFDSMSPFGG